jgi:hypothetical protein
MRSLRCKFHLAISMLFTLPSPTFAQTYASIPAIDFDNSAPRIRAHAEALKPFTVAGEHGVVLGQQDGMFEAWVLPVKLLSHMTIEAQVEGYTVPIDVNQQAAEIEVRTDRTTITYSHIAFTVHQVMYSPNGADAGYGPAGALRVRLPASDEFHLSVYAGAALDVAGAE